MRILPVLFGFSLFCSAFLSFSVQPILGKMLLPLVGGAPAAWIVALAFFQLSLLAGYGVSWALGRASVEIHALGLIVLYVAGQKFLPPHIALDGRSLEGVAVSWSVFHALAGAVFIPFIALTATTSALQRIFSSTRHETAQDPYYLFVASNAGSFAGLLAFPVLFEPFVGMTWVAHLWKILYTATTILVCSSIFAAWKNRASYVSPQTAPKTVASAPDGKTVLWWLVLSFIPCSLSMGVTTLITTDLGGLPLFWVIPLGLYLLTFILAFARTPLVNAEKLSFWHLVGVQFIVLALGFGIGYQPSGHWIVFMLLVTAMLAVFFAIALACHQRLAGLRPPVGQLPLFYFMIALGGGLAGILHAFVVPFVFPDVVEFPLVVLLSLLLHPAWHTKPKNERQRLVFNGAFAVSVGMALLVALLRYKGVQESIIDPAVLIFAIATLVLAFQPRRVLVIGLIVFATGYGFRYPGEVIARGRNFFGNYAITNTEYNGRPTRFFIHGSTLHGLALLEEGDQADRYHIGYYARGNPIRDVLNISGAKTIAVVGLGSGQLGCYDSKIVTDFYEIDAEVEQIARTLFPYLETCNVRDVLIGDGRLELARQNRRYDAVLLDAFTSDGVPVHLLTSEAMTQYRDVLNPKGVMLFHISNRYLDLAPPLAASAEAIQLKAYQKIHRPTKENPMTLESVWVAIPLTPQGGEALLKQKWQPIVPAAHAWTDDRSSVLSAVSFNGGR